MASRKDRIITFDTVKDIGLALPGVELGTSFGQPALKANGRSLATLATNKSAEPDSLCVTLGIPDRDELVEADPTVFYLTSHYVPWPCVVVRLARIHEDALEDLLRMSRDYCLAKPKPGRKKPAATTRHSRNAGKTRLGTAPRTRKAAKTNRN